MSSTAKHCADGLRPIKQRKELRPILRAMTQHKDWPAMADALNPLVAQLRQAQPDVLKGFSQMAQGALKSDALDTKTKELIALAISVAIRRECGEGGRKRRRGRRSHGIGNLHGRGAQRDVWGASSGSCEPVARGNCRSGDVSRTPTIEAGPLRRFRQVHLIDRPDRESSGIQD